MANKILNLDFSKDPIMPPIIYGRVGDEKMQTITVKISRRDEIPDLSGGVITFEGEPAGGKVKVFDSENVSSNNAGLQKGTFEYTFPSAAFSVEGTYKRAYFSFQKDGKRDTTGDFKIIVKGNADIDAEEAETIITEYNKLVKALNEAYQVALEKMNTDYDEVVKRIETIKTEMNVLQAKIDKTVSDAEGRIGKATADSEAKINTTAKNAETNIAAIGKSVTEEMNKALQELNAADFYTKSEAEAKFAEKGEAYTKQESDGKYAEKGESYTKQDSDGKYVDLLSNQEIAGVKNFSDGLQISGKNLTDSLMEMLLNVGKKIWEGTVYLNETQSVKPSIPLDKCFTGWVALYQPYDSNTGKAQPWDLNYMFIPKTHAVDYSGVAIVHHLETLNGAKFNKYIYVTNTEIKGHKNNGTAAKDYVITKLYSV